MWTLLVKAERKHAAALENVAEFLKKRKEQYECADICEHEFDVEVELGMSGLRVNYTMSNASSVIVWNSCPRGSSKG